MRVPTIKSRRWSCLLLALAGVLLLNMVGFSRVGDSSHAARTRAPSPALPLSTEEEYQAYDRLVARGASGSGQLSRLAERVREGRPITVLTVGGSITRGSHSKTTFSSFLQQHFDQRHPGQFKVFNLGKPATGSYYFAHCLSSYSLALTNQSLEAHAPDLVILETSANDFAQSFAKTTRMATPVAFESLVRGLLGLPSRPAVLLLDFAVHMRGQGYCDCTLFEDHRRYAEHYDLPHLGLHQVFGINSSLLVDHVHPGLAGHALIAEVLLRTVLPRGSVPPPPGGRSGPPVEIPPPLGEILSDPVCFAASRHQGAQALGALAWSSEWREKDEAIIETFAANATVELAFWLPQPGHVGLIAMLTLGAPEFSASLDSQPARRFNTSALLYGNYGIVDLYQNVGAGPHLLRLVKEDRKGLSIASVISSAWDHAGGSGDAERWDL